MSELESLRNKLDRTVSMAEMERRKKQAVIDDLVAMYNTLSDDDYFRFEVVGEYSKIKVYGYNGLLRVIGIWGDSPAAIIADISREMLEYM